NAFEAVINVHKAPRLVARTPDLNFVFAAELRFDYLAAHGGGRLFPASFISTEGPINVVEPGHASGDAKVLSEVTAHPLAKKLFPAIAVFRESGVSILFF